MVRIAYRTSSGIYGPKDATFPKVIRDVEMQLKRCRLREHSLKRCISVLLVVVAFCMCGLIVGLLSTCENEDHLQEINDIGTSDMKPVVDDPLRTTHEGSSITEITDDAEEWTTESMMFTSEVPIISPAITELSYETTSTDTEGTTYAGTELTTPTSAILENNPTTDGTETFVEDATTQGVNQPFPSSESVVHSYDEMNTLRILSNIQETMPTCAPAKAPAKAPAPADSPSEPTSPSSSEQRRTSSVVQPESKPELPDSSKMSTNVNNLGLYVQPEPGSGISSVQAIVTPVQRDTIVKVSFLTTSSGLL